MGEQQGSLKENKREKIEKKNFFKNLTTTSTNKQKKQNKNKTKKKGRKKEKQNFFPN